MVHIIKMEKMWLPCAFLANVNCWKMKQIHFIFFNNVKVFFSIHDDRCSSVLVIFNVNIWHMGSNQDKVDNWITFVAHILSIDFQLAFLNASSYKI
jgi:hypothetical protein